MPAGFITFLLYAGAVLFVGLVAALVVILWVRVRILKHDLSWPPTSKRERRDIDPAMSRWNETHSVPAVIPEPRDTTE